MTKRGSTLIEITVVLVITGILAGMSLTSSGLSLPSTEQEAYLLADLIESGIVQARLSGQEMQITVSEQVAELRATDLVRSRLNTRSTLRADTSEISISANGVIRPTTILLTGSGHCHLVVSLRGRTRSVCSR